MNTMIFLRSQSPSTINRVSINIQNNASSSVTRLLSNQFSRKDITKKYNKEGLTRNFTTINTQNNKTSQNLFNFNFHSQNILHQSKSLQHGFYNDTVLRSSFSTKITETTSDEKEESESNKLSISQKSLNFAKSIPQKILNIPSFLVSLPERSKAWPAIIKEVAHHYWVGSKLFVLEIRTAAGIIRGITKGKVLTRRERKILITTFNDLLRLIPFSIFVIVPFMELLLPFALKLFPNMLPSTFEDKLQKEEALKKRLKARLQFAKFLQDAAEELTQKPELQSQSADLDLGNLMKKVKEGVPVSNDEILKFARIFEDELTLDNLDRPQLVNMCKYMDLNTLGNDTVLRFLLTQKFKQIKADDVLIQKEGIESLSLEELQAALRARGMQGTTKNRLALRRRLTEWLDLSLNHNLPASVLVLSRALVINEKDHYHETYEERLKETISSLPKDLVEEVKLKLDESRSKSNLDLKYEVLSSQKKHIDEDTAAAAKKERVDAKSTGNLDEKLKKEPSLVSLKADTHATHADAHADSHHHGDGETHNPESEILEDISEAVSVLAHPSSVRKERNELSSLKADRELLKAESEAIKAQKKYKSEESKIRKDLKLDESEKSGDTDDHDVNIQKSLQSRLDKMVQDLENEVENVEKAVGMKLNILDKDQDGVISADELANALELLKDKLPKVKMDDLISKFDKDNDGKISLEELIQYIDEHTQNTEKKD